MAAIATGADLLNYDRAIMDNDPNGPHDAVFHKLHATPLHMGEVAAVAQPKALALSHLGPNTLPRLEWAEQLSRTKGFTARLWSPTILLPTTSELRINP